MSQSLNSTKMAEILFKILKDKKELTFEDVVFQFEVAPSTAYSILRILRAMCEKRHECEVQVRNRRTVLVWSAEEEQEIRPDRTGDER